MDVAKENPLTAMPLSDFQKCHPGMPQVDASLPIPAEFLERAALCNRRMVLTLDGRAMAVLVSLADFDLLEVTSHGIDLGDLG